jgi:hypothetical protein
MKKEIDCSYTDKIVCPHCGYEFQMSYEIFYNPDDDFFRGLECEKCKGEFDVERCIEVTYSSYKKK